MVMERTWRHHMETFSVLLALFEGNSPVIGRFRPRQCDGALLFSLICDWTNSWANNRDTRHSRRHRAHYDVTVMNLTANQWFTISLPTSTMKIKYTKGTQLMKREFWKDSPGLTFQVPVPLITTADRELEHNWDARCPSTYMHCSGKTARYVFFIFSLSQ